MNLKYIILRRRKDEIRVNYIYFGHSTKREVIDTEEGELYWVNRDELLNKEFTATIRSMFQHYFEFGEKTGDILVGVASVDSEKPVMNWNPLQDWEKV